MRRRMLQGPTAPATARRSRALSAALGIMLAVGLIAGCSSDPPADPKQELAAAKRRLDDSKTVRFTLDGTELPKKGAVIVSADGYAKKPASFTGRFRFATGGIGATIRVVSVDGTLYAQKPFSDGYIETTADELGVADPADLLQPERGLSSLITAARQAKTVGQSRKGREVFNEITASIPASIVGRFLLLKDESSAIRTKFSVLADSHELRKATFEGPFYGKGTKSTYTVTLDRYDQPVDIEPPQ